MKENTLFGIKEKREGKKRDGKFHFNCRFCKSIDSVEWDIDAQTYICFHCGKADAKRKA